MTPELTRHFAALFNRRQAQRTVSSDHRQAFLDTLRTIEPGGVNLSAVYYALAFGCEQQGADKVTSGIVQPYIRRHRNKIERLKKRASRALTDIIHLHAGANPEQLEGDPYLVEPYRQTIVHLDRDPLLAVWTSRQRRRGAPTQHWLAIVKQMLKQAGVKGTDRNDLLHQIGLIPGGGQE